MKVLGVKVIGHDTGAALIANGKVIAIAEERLNRVKHSPNMFPVLSIQYCLETFGIKPGDLDLVVIDQVKFTRSERDLKAYFLSHTTGFEGVRIEVINHQDAHAASAFFCSPFDEAAIMVYDGSGEKFTTHLGVAAVESDTMYYGKGNWFEQIQKTVHRFEKGAFPFTTGIGKLYTRLCEKYIGLGRYNEGKMMGLASFGNDSILKQFPPSRWYKNINGHVVCNARISHPPQPFFDDLRRIRSVKEFFTFVTYRVRRAVGRATRFARTSTEPFEELMLPQPPRLPSQTLPDKYYASVAYAGQKILEEVTLLMAQKLFKLTRVPNITISGGVGLNIDANRKILDESGFKHIFIQPGASDAGVALGSALYGYHMILKQPRFYTMNHASLGRRYTAAEVEKALAERATEIVFRKSTSIAVEAATYIADGKIIGWFEGGSEYGPRALGNRSILADARRTDMKDILNHRVKHRESWRPFAAVVLKDRVRDYFDLDEESPFMILLSKVTSETQSKIPSVVHVDLTTRIQTVTKEYNGLYYELLAEFYKRTGVPLIINTSFNLGGEPIVETPQDALKSFLSTDMDYLCMEGFIIEKKKK